MNIPPYTFTRAKVFTFKEAIRWASFPLQDNSADNINALRMITAILDIGDIE